MKRLPERITLASDDSSKKKNSSSNQSFELLEETTRRRLFSQLVFKSQYYLSVCTDQSPLPGNWTLSQALNYQRQQFPAGQGALRLHLNLDATSKTTRTLDVNAVRSLTTILEEFAALGGLAVLSQHLPMLLCASASPSLLTFDNGLPMKATGGHAQPMATASTTNQSMISLFNLPHHFIFI